jgi:hypothetical protein
MCFFYIKNLAYAHIISVSNNNKIVCFYLFIN